MPGPLPDPHARRRNKPTIPSVDLPAGGYRGHTPKPPTWVTLGEAGLAWWKWAWRTPQAARWAGGGFEVLLARRASLEDDLAALDRISSLDFKDLVDSLDEDDRTDQELKRILLRLASLVTNRLAVAQKMLDIEDRVGLTPKGFENLRWRIVAPKADDVPESTPRKHEKVSRLDDRRQRLTGSGAS